MCQDCEQKLQHQADYFGGKISTLMDALKMGTDHEWELSEPICVGGPNGTYKVRAPFVGDCQVRADIAAAGASAAQIVVSMSPKQFGFDFTGILIPQGFNETMYDGIVINVPANNSIPVTSEWYNIRNSENTVYVLVIIPPGTSNSASINLIFRQKRN